MLTNKIAPPQTARQKRAPRPTQAASIVDPMVAAKGENLSSSLFSVQRPTSGLLSAGRVRLEMITLEKEQPSGARTLLFGLAS